jgi:cycloartenol synthase
VKKPEEKDEVTEEMVLASLRRALDQFSSLQSDDGCWPGDFSGIMFIMPGLVRITPIFTILLIYFIFEPKY